jgi:hypothetical protein
MRTTASGEARLGAVAWGFILLGWLAITVAWLDGRVLMMVDQWREWWTVYRWWNEGIFAPPRTTSGFGFVPPWYMALLWPMASLGWTPSASWSAPVLVGGLAAIFAADHWGGRRAALLMAFALLGPPGLFWLYANVSASWGWIVVMLGWSLALTGRPRLGVGIAAVGAWFGYVVLPAFCGLAIWVVLDRPKERTRWGAAVLAGLVVAAGYLVPAWSFAGAPTAGRQIGGVVEAALFAAGGPWISAAAALVALAVMVNPAHHSKGVTMFVVWAGTAIGLASKTNYWALHYTLTTLAVLLVIALSTIIDRRVARAAVLWLCAVLPAAVWLWPGTPTMRPSDAVLEPGTLPGPDQKVWHVDLSWRHFSAALADAADRRAAGDLLPVVEWAQHYAGLVTGDGQRVTTTVAGPWCDTPYYGGCRFVAAPDPFSGVVSGATLLEVTVPKGGVSPLSLRFVMSNCTPPYSTRYERPAEARWVDQYSRWKFVTPIDNPGCASFALLPVDEGWTLWYRHDGGVYFRAAPRPTPFVAY